jgi:Peptidase S24-like/Helix-turn-helix
LFFVVNAPCFNDISSICEVVIMNNTKEFMARVYEEAVRIAGNIKELSKLIGIPRTTINGWIKDGAIPSAERFAILLDFIGGNLSRALPDCTLGNHPHPEIQIFGRVTANSERWSVNAEKFSISSCDEVYKRSKLYHMTTGKSVYLQVEGDSMAPVYPHASVICCRRPSVGIDQIPAGSPVICEVEGENNFKLISHDRNKNMVILTPINPGHQVTICHDRKIKIPYLVVGHLSPTMGTINDNGVLHSFSPDKPKSEDLSPVKV